MSSRRSRTAGTVAALALVAGGLTLLPGAAPPALADTLVPYQSCDALLTYYRSELVRTATPYGAGGVASGGFVMEDSARPKAASALAVAGSGPTGTNIQERGVDEPDSVKTVGGLLFAFSADALQIVRTGARPTLLSSLALKTPAYGAELLVQDDRVLVVLPGGGGMNIASGGVASSSLPTDLASTTRLMLVDVADPTAPKLLESLELDARYLSARLSEGAVRLVTASTPAPSTTSPAEPYGPPQEKTALEANRAAARSATLEQVLPTAVRRDGSGQVVSRGPAVECDSVRHTSAPQGVSTLLVTTLDLGKGLEPQDRTAVTTDGDLVYASADRLYVATSRWGTTGPLGGPVTSNAPITAPITDRVTTELHAFDTTSPTTTRYAGSGSVPGYVYGRWALSSYAGHLRVATTTSPPWDEGGPISSSSVTVLQERADGLVETGRLDGLGPGERIFAVRYFGDLATVVTFRQTDPLYVLDLSDPTAPRLQGELKVPGFSTYLHPVGDDRLLGIGQDADADGRVIGLQVSLFDLSDRSRPTQSDRLSLGEGYSPALYDSRAFGYDPERRLALLPMTSYDAGSAKSVNPDNEAIGIRVSEAGTLSLVGRLALDPQTQIDRVLHDDTQVYAVSRAGVTAAGADDLSRTGSVDFPGGPTR